MNSREYFAPTLATIAFILCSSINGEVIAELLWWVGEDKLLFSSDYAIWTPQWLVEKFKHNAVFSGLVDEQKADEIVAAIEKLDECENIGQFVEKYLVYEK